jgi:hypothetical protein
MALSVRVWRLKSKRSYNGGMYYDGGIIFITVPFGSGSQIPIPLVIAMPCIAVPISAAAVAFLVLWAARNQRKDENQQRR